MICTLALEKTTLRISLNKMELKRSKPYPISNANGTTSTISSGALSRVSTMPFKTIGTDILAIRASTRKSKPIATR